MSPPVYSPPALKFLITSFAYSCGTNLCTFTCTTDVACHLTAHVTAQRPIIRRIPYQKRGAEFVLSSVTCFVPIATPDQAQAGDTFAHTFTIPFPLSDHTYYWYLTGTIGGVPCTSISQIFWHACPAVPITTEFPNYAGGRLYGGGSNWDILHDKASSSYRQYGTPSVDASKHGGYHICRGFASFDTTALGGVSIISAKVMWKLGIHQGNFYVHVVEGVQNIPIVNTDYGAHLDKVTSFGVGGPCGPWINGTWNDIPLNWLGLLHINQFGITKFCFKHHLDLLDIPPTYLSNMTCSSIKLSVTYWS